MENHFACSIGHDSDNSVAIATLESELTETDIVHLLRGGFWVQTQKPLFFGMKIKTDSDGFAGIQDWVK